MKLKNVKVRVPVPVKEACESAARISKTSIQVWAITALDASCGLVPRPAGHTHGFAAVPDAGGRGGRDATMQLYLTPKRVKEYTRAATLACLALRTWMGIVLAAACGCSELGGQLRRLRPQ